MKEYEKKNQRSTGKLPNKYKINHSAYYASADVHNEKPVLKLVHAT